ncbi:MAG: nucleoside triphosphate pyrophosphohydrolase [Oscillospiraceae bacterium]|jgi:tetrapyrrole methylase family protein/MazG family protein|nr:nucleoside triphosphate pyrophosphohydrolase [Oscillospiraceae bacterium]
MVNFESSDKYGVEDLRRLIKLLRSPEGCPWDQEQTHLSIRRNFLEEAYEAVEAIDENDPLHLREELGDVLTQVVFHADIEDDAGTFDLDDVADAVVRKLLFRHPHVFGDVTVSGSGEVLQNWDELKRVEKSQSTVSDSLSSVAKSLPALWRAEKIQKKAAKVGFDWEDVSGAFDKLREEVDELDAAIVSGDLERAFFELGDVLFSAVNVARRIGADPEDALSASSDMFVARFSKMEEMVSGAGLTLAGMSAEEMDVWYRRAKRLL